MRNRNRVCLLVCTIAVVFSTLQVSAIDSIEDLNVQLAGGASTNFFYNDLITNAAGVKGAARVAGIPLGIGSERMGVMSFDHEKITYQAPANWLGTESIRYRLVDDNNALYGNIYLNVIEPPAPTGDE